MAVRVAQWMTMPHKVKGVATGGNGRIITANGDRDAAAWANALHRRLQRRAQRNDLRYRYLRSP